MMFVVTFPSANGRVPLRGTVIAFHMDRAEKFPTREAAEAGLAKARKFMRATIFKTARIEAAE